MGVFKIYQAHQSAFSQDPTMLALSAFVLLTSVACLLQPANGFSCSECVDEMHKLGWMVKMGAVPIHDYISENYCPTLGDQEDWCEEKVSRYYVGMLFAVVEHYFVDGAIHVCQTGGACDAKSSGYLPPNHPESREYTCDECIQGLEWVEAYIEDPIMIAEYVVYLEQNFCLSGHHHDQDACKQLVVEHFPAMHAMAMEKFFIPTEICMHEPVCGADPPTKPPMVHGL